MLLEFHQRRSAEYSLDGLLLRRQKARRIGHTLRAALSCVLASKDRAHFGSMPTIGLEPQVLLKMKLRKRPVGYVSAV
jgi:hypothetical protein